MCDNKTVNGVFREGGYGEYATIRTEAAVRVPKDMDVAKVAPLLCAGSSSCLPYFHLVAAVLRAGWLIS